MRHPLRVTFPAVGLVVLLTAACGNSPDQASPTEPAPPQFTHMGGVNPFFVFCDDVSCPNSGSKVVVTGRDKREHPKWTKDFIETCTKPVDRDHCVGAAHNYSRSAPGDPWTID